MDYYTKIKDELIGDKKDIQTCYSVSIMKLLIRIIFIKKSNYLHY